MKPRLINVNLKCRNLIFQIKFIENNKNFEIKNVSVAY